jgi:hypothetical protein
MPSDLRRRKLTKSFGSLDFDQDGVIDEVDAVALAQLWCDTFELDPRSEDWRRIHRCAYTLLRDVPGEFDADGIKRITLEQWLAWGDHPDFTSYVEKIAIPFSVAVFTAADKDKDGLLTPPDMMAAHLKAEMSEADSQLAFSSLDTDGDGYVSVSQYFAANREFYLSEDPAARGNFLAGRL